MELDVSRNGECAVFIIPFDRARARFSWSPTATEPDVTFPSLRCFVRQGTFRIFRLRLPVIGLPFSGTELDGFGIGTS